MGNQVFISYRRKDGFYPAYLLYKELIENNYTVFFDIKSLRIVLICCTFYDKKGNSCGNMPQIMLLK